jgi:hypothetical protein
MQGGTFLVPRVADLEPTEVIEATLSHLGCPEAEPERSRWVAENYLDVAASVSATEKVRGQDGLDSIDSRAFQVVYGLHVPADECRAILKQHPGLQAVFGGADRRLAGVICGGEHERQRLTLEGGEIGGERTGGGAGQARRAPRVQVGIVRVHPARVDGEGRAGVGIEQVRAAAAAEDRSVSSWIRRAVETELGRPA